jgi:hypothetical protein
MQLGIYQHYKGPRYRVHGVVRHSETFEMLVYYECLYENPNGQFWVRPVSMFEETVHHEGKTLPRFTWVGE